MKVEIWSDIMCPFCYIGKRNFEAALKEFEAKNEIEIEWKSFQLDPTIPKSFENKVSTYEYLAERKGMPLERSKELHDNIVETARKVGLTYNFEKAVVANSFDAHKLIQLAKTKGLGDAAEESLFKAYFTDGKDMSEHSTLVQLGKEIGLNEEDVMYALASEEFEAKVNFDVSEGNQLGVTGVPFFVFDRKYAVSGAQPIETFLNALKQSHAESKNEGTTCAPGGGCC
jgi:predicted DsbA family dithiol-disulfide isomerase